MTTINVLLPLYLLVEHYINRTIRHKPGSWNVFLSGVFVFIFLEPMQTAMIVAQASCPEYLTISVRPYCINSKPSVVHKCRTAGKYEVPDLKCQETDELYVEDKRRSR